MTDPAAAGTPAQALPDRSLGRGFTALWTATTLSNLADGILKISLPLVAVRFTTEPALVAAVDVVLTLPWLVFVLQAGAIVDRADRRRIMLLANVARASLLVAVGVAILTDQGALWVIYLMALLIGTTETFYDNAAQSFVPQLVPPAQLSRANGRLHAAELTANQFIGPPLGGLLVGAGVSVALLTPAGLWGLAVAVLAFVPGVAPARRTHKTRMRDEIAEGVRFLAGNRVLRTLALMVGAMNLSSSATFGILVLYVVGPASQMQLDAPAYGLLITTCAIGSVVGALGADRVVRRLGKSITLVGSVVGCCALGLAPAVTSSWWLMAVLFVAGGLGIGVWNVVTVSLRQAITPDHLRGRVNSCYRLLAWGTMPVGAAMGGLIAQWSSLKVSFWVAACFSLVALLGNLIVTDQAIEDAEAAAAAAEAA